MDNAAAPDSSLQSHHAVATGPEHVGDLKVEWRGLEPVPADRRYGNMARVGAVWFSSNLTPVSFFVGVVGVTIGLSLWQNVLAILIGNVLGAIPTGLLSSMGARTGAPQIGLARLPFGKSVSLVSLLVYVQGALYLALAAIFGVQALQVLFHLSFVPALLIVFVGEAIVSLVGYELLQLFESAAAVLAGIGFLLLTGVTLSKLSQVHIHQTVHGPAAAGTFILMVAIVFGYEVGWAPYSADYCRYLPTTTSRAKLFAWCAGSLVAASAWLEILGVIAGGILPDQSPMQAMYNLIGGGPLGVMLMIAVYLGVIGYIAPTDYSAGLQALAGGIRIRRPYLTFFTAVLCGVLTWWLSLGDLSSKTENILLLATYWVSPFIAIVAIDWWRRSDSQKDNIKVTDYLHLPSGWRAAVALVVGYAVALPFSNTTTGADLAAHGGILSVVFGSVTRSALNGGDLAFFAGIAGGGVAYVLLTASGGRRAEARSERSQLADAAS